MTDIEADVYQNNVYAGKVVVRDGQLTVVDAQGRIDPSLGALELLVSLISHFRSTHPRFRGAHATNPSLVAAALAGSPPEYGSVRVHVRR